MTHTKGGANTTFTFSNYEKGKSGTDVDFGQIPEILFYSE